MQNILQTCGRSAAMKLDTGIVPMGSWQRTSSGSIFSCLWVTENNKLKPDNGSGSISMIGGVVRIFKQLVESPVGTAKFPPLKNGAQRLPLLFYYFQHWEYWGSIPYMYISSCGIPMLGEFFWAPKGPETFGQPSQTPTDMCIGRVQIRSDPDRPQTKSEQNSF